jgi:hypothetical protein
VGVEVTAAIDGAGYHLGKFLDGHVKRFRSNNGLLGRGLSDGRVETTGYERLLSAQRVPKTPSPEFLPLRFTSGRAT